MANVVSNVAETAAVYQVTGMSCGHCEHAIRAEVGVLPGVAAVDVSAATGVLVVHGHAVTDAAVLAAVEEAGYQAERV